MATQRTAVPTKLRQVLIDKAAGKCANPGCVAFRTHLHHIEAWAVYQTHDEEHMVAICPTCHDAVHDGPLSIDDETLRRWKSVDRSAGTGTHDHVYVEPGESSKLLLGSIAVTGPDGLSVFELGASNRLSFRLQDTDIMLVSLAISTTAGTEILRVTDGHVRSDARPPITYQRVPGHVRVTAPVLDEYMPGWALEQLRRLEPTFAADGQLPLLDIEVMEPGLVRVQGLWIAPNHAVAITTEALSFLDPARPLPLSIRGDGAGTVLHYVGPISTALFGIGDDPGALHIPRRVAPRVGRNDPCWCGSGVKFKRCHGG